MGLMEYGYREIARSVAEKTGEMVRRCGFREFYNSGTGKGHGGKSYGMSTMAVDMIERLEGGIALASVTDTDARRPPPSRHALEAE
jgi:hypothetical protein